MQPLLNWLDRCDSKAHCADSSDELECNVVEFGSSYNKYLTPPTPNSKLNKYSDSTKLEIHATIAVHKLLHFDALTHTFDAEFTLDLEWFDSRVKFNNLRSKPKVNALLPEEVSLLWFPYFIFYNTDKREIGSVDEEAIFHVLKKEEGKMSEFYALENKHVYRGDENYIEYQRFYSKHFECYFSLHWYPFDTQTCKIEIVPFADLKDLIEFVTEAFEYEGPKDLTEFTIKRIGMKVVNRGRLEVSIVIQRRLLSILMTTFIPTLILNIIGHMSNYFKEFFFEGLMSLNVTVMLVLTTMFLR